MVWEDQGSIAYSADQGVDMKRMRTWMFIAMATPIASFADQVVDDRILAQAMYDSVETSCDELGVTPDDLVNLLSYLKSEIRKRLERGEQVRLHKFGTFFLEEVPAKEVVTRDGKKVTLPEYDNIRFDSYSAVKEKEEELLAGKE